MLSVPIGQRGDGLRPADAENVADTGAPGRRQHQRIDRLPPLAGVTITMRPTPATRAGIAFISTEEG